MTYNLNKIHLFEWQDLYYFDFETGIGFSAFKALTLSQEKSLDSQEKKFRKALAEDKAFNEINPENHSDYYFQVYEWDAMTINEIKRLQRYSIVLSIFSFYEGRLKTICDKIENSFELETKIDNLNKRHGDIMRYWNYLKNVFKINIDSIDKYFKPITKQKIVRNIIAHSEGVTRENQWKSIKNVKGLELNSSGSNSIIEIRDTDYITDLIDKMDNFFKELLVEIDIRYKQLDRMKNTLLNDILKENGHG